MGRMKKKRKGRNRKRGNEGANAAIFRGRSNWKTGKSKRIKSSPALGLSPRVNGGSWPIRCRDGVQAGTEDMYGIHLCVCTYSFPPVGVTINIDNNARVLLTASKAPIKLLV